MAHKYMDITKEKNAHIKAFNSLTLTLLFRVTRYNLVSSKNRSGMITNLTGENGT